MDKYCEVCDKFIKPKNKYKHFKSNMHKEFDKSKHIILTIENLFMNEVDSIFCSYITEHNKKIDFFSRNAFLN